jgi:hypothetical protein
MKCEKCGKAILLGERYFVSDGGIYFCGECGDDRLSKSTYGLYDSEADHGDPDSLLDDDLTDVDFFEEKNG